MRSIQDLQPHDHRTITSDAATRGILLDELGSALFASLRRSDQRRRGVEYVRGLLETEGRKSIRNIAVHIGPPATEQGLHHFISDSTWDWHPLRLVLARYLARHAPPQAWVVRPTVIPKAGRHSVGVGRHFHPDLGQSLNGQRAVGVWAASETLSGPVDWRLHLSQDWLDQPERRRRAAIPDDAGAETPGDCAVEALLGAQARHDLPHVPFVHDARGSDVARIVRRLRAARIPVLVRIPGTHRLVVADSALPGHSAEPLLAHQVMDAAHRLRRPASVLDGGTGPSRINLAATVRVREPGRPGAPPRAARSSALTLLGIGAAARPWPAELWLTDMTDTPASALTQLTTLVHRVDRDFADITDQVGIRDFAGRSFTGWHRHVTLASAAHAVAALAGRSGRPARLAASRSA